MHRLSSVFMQFQTAKRQGAGWRSRSVNKGMGDEELHEAREEIRGMRQNGQKCVIPSL
jgi:hypothetical protein